MQTLNTGYTHQKNCASNASIAKCYEVLADIYKDGINLTVWQRNLSQRLRKAAHKLIEDKPNLQTAITLSPKNAFACIIDVLGTSEYARVLGEDMSHVIDMFCYLFELKEAGLRLAVLDKAMCPRFHVDRVPCRLITTYYGISTEWLPNPCANRGKLGSESIGEQDDCTGLFANVNDIQHIEEGDVALLKGEKWLGNEGKGLIHRSPILRQGNKRLVMTLDFIGV